MNANRTTLDNWDDISWTDLAIFTAIAVGYIGAGALIMGCVLYQAVGTLFG